jgi:hypothetical protein
MNQTIDLLIDRFRKAQDIGVKTLTDQLEIPRPISNRHWWRYCQENDLYSIDNQNGVGIYAHGYGIALTIGKLRIDFDWGDNGEADGFDGWRLYNFACDNCPEIGCSHEIVIDWLEEALKEGSLIKSGELYYDPKRRKSI